MREVEIEEQVYYLEESLDKARERNRELEKFITGRIDRIEVKGNTYGRKPSSVQIDKEHGIFSWGRIVKWFRKGD